MKEQLEMEQLSQACDVERDERIKQLESELEEAAKQVNNNKAASDILTNLLEKGDMKQEADGSITIVRGPNVIGNKDDVDM